MKRPAIFFDRDNTLIVCDAYLGDPEGVRLVDGAADAIARARELGFVVVTISNQAGVARGLFPEESVRLVNARLDKLLRRENHEAIIERHEYCPFHPEAVVDEYRQDSEFRKPKPGMILRAAEELNLDLTQSWVIGDTPRDVEAGKAAGCRTILFRDESISPSRDAAAASSAEPDEVVSSLREALDTIEAAVGDSMWINPPPARSEAAEEMPAEVVEVKEPSPSPGTQGEGRGEGDLGAPATIDSQNHPHPNPLPEYREREPEEPSLKNEAPTLPEEDARPAVVVPPPAEEPVRVVVDAPQVDLSKLEKLTEQILYELRRGHEHAHADFSVSKLLAGVAQAMALAALVLAFFYRDDLVPILLVAIMIQTLTIALLIMGRDRS